MIDPNYDIPSWVLDKIESCDFKDLNPDDQTKVLRHITEREYTDLRDASSQLHQIFWRDIEPSPVIKANLMEAFDKKHSPVRQQFFGSGGKLGWLKAAAVIVCILSVGIGISKRMNPGTGKYNNKSECDSNQLMRQFDTLTVSFKVKPDNNIPGILLFERNSQNQQNSQIKRKEENGLKKDFNHYRKTEQEVLYSA